MEYLSLCKVRKQNKITKSNQKNKDMYSDFSKIMSSKFSAYLQSLDGGKKPPALAQQQGYIVRQMLNGSDIKDISEFNENECISKLQNFIESFSKGHENSSTVTYISILISFLKFISDEMGEVNNYIINKLIDKSRNWKKYYRGQISGHKNFEDVPANEVKFF